MAEKKAPEIRFRGFDEEWKTQEFNSTFICSIPNNTLSRAELNYDNGVIKSVHYGDILINYGSIINCSKDIIPYITNGNINHYKNQLLQDGDILIADTAEDETVGKAAEIAQIKSSYVVSGLHTIVCRPIIPIAPDYMGYFINSPAFHNQLLPLMQGIKVLAISRTSLFQTEISYPIKNQEQDRIGDLFVFLDQLIFESKQKIEKLQQVKAAMLEKMFPKEGADVPEIRFAGFSDHWEKHTIGELMNVFSAARVHKNEWKEYGVPFFRASDVTFAFKQEKNTKAFISYDLFEELSKKSGKLQQGDILITGGGTIGIPYLVPNNDPLYFKDGDLLCIQKSDSVNCNFLYIFFTTQLFRNYVNSITHIGTISHYTIEQINATPVKFPKISEQKKIGEFFHNLDEQINLQQKELEKLQNLKAALLEKMFI